MNPAVPKLNDILIQGLSGLPGLAFCRCERNSFDSVKLLKRVDYLLKYQTSKDVLRLVLQDNGAFYNTLLLMTTIITDYNK